MSRGLSKNIIDKILDGYPQINIDWLVSGNENMLKSPKDDAVEINPDIMMIPLVSQYAYVGYMNGVTDAEHIETLPTIPIFIDREF